MRVHEPGGSNCWYVLSSPGSGKIRIPILRFDGGRGCTTAFLLPYYVEKDFALVAAELYDAGYPVETEWFAPHIEFRFPVYGRVNYGGIGRSNSVRLLSPGTCWARNQAAERQRATAADSSVERMQVRVTGMIGERYWCDPQRAKVAA